MDETNTNPSMDPMTEEQKKKEEGQEEKVSTEGMPKASSEESAA
ncbi:MAG: hypothetical protein WC095_00095 [Candidatus Paceibacterota bacterium]